VAEAYTKTIEFKAKDAQIQRAVKKLGKSLEGIDKSLDKINKAFSKSVKGGIKETVKEVGKISAIIKDLANVTKKIEVVPKQKITQSIKDIRKINNLMKQLKTVSSPFSGDGRKSDERNAAVDGLQKYINAVTNGTRAIATNEAALNRQANAFALVAANVRIGGAQYINIVQAQEKAEQKLRLAQFDRIKAQEQLYNVSNLQGGIDQTGFKNVNKLLAMESNRFMQGGASDTTASLNAYKAELENVNSLLKIGSKEYYLVEEAIERINRRLGTKTRLVREEEKAVASQAKFYRDIAVQIDKIARKGFRNIGKVFEGKFGGTAQAGGIYALTRGIEDLTTKWKFLDQQIKIPLLGDRQLSSVANFVRRSQEGITALAISYQGLSGLLGAASWTIGAISGFKKWESEAASAIWSVNRQVKAFSDSLNAMYLMLQGKGGTPGGVAQNLRDMILGGEQRQENQRFADQGPTNKQLIQKDLDLQIQKLKQRNTTEQDYVEILQRQKQLERELRREQKKERVMRVKAGEPFEKVFKDEIDARDKRLKEATDKELEHERGLRKERAKRAKFNKQVLQSELKDIAKKKKEELDGIKRVMQADQRAHQKALDMEKQRRQARSQRLSRMGENLMLGAGFPMLFGGGAGAVAGGTLGAVGQSLMGSQGFGAQILLSALGQQFDAFASKVATLGQAFTAIDKDVTPVVEALGLTGSAFEKQIKILDDLGEKEAAFNLAREKMIELVGGSGVDALTEFGSDTKALTDDWSRLMTQMGAGLAAMINSAGILKALAESINRTVILNQAIENKDNDPELTRLNKIFEKYSTGEIRPGGLTNKGERHDFPSMMELNEMLVARQKILNTNNLSLKTDKIRTLTFDAQIAKLKEKLDLRNATSKEEKAALTIEKEVTEILNKFKEADIVLTKTQIEQIRTYVTELNKVKPKVEQLDQLWKDIGMSIKDGLVDGINAAIDGTKTLGEVASNTFRRISNALLNYGVEAALIGMTGGTGGFFSKVFGRASGGPVKGGSPYVVGEKGPELFVPGSSGNIVPNHEMGGSTNVVVNVDASGSSVAGDAGQADQLGSMLAAAVQAEIANQKRPGGLLA